MVQHGFGGPIGPCRFSDPLVDRLRPLPPEDLSTREKEIRQRAGDDEAVGVLREAAVADLREAEDPFDGQRVINGGRLRTFARARGLRWRRSQEPRRRLIDGGWRCVTHGRQQFSGFLEA